MSAPPKFDWDKANRDHLALHDVKPEEFEQMFEHFRVETTQTRNNEKRVWCLGQTDSGRLLTAVYTERNGLIRAVTAHTMKRKNRSIYAEAIKEAQERDRRRPGKAHS